MAGFVLFLYLVMTLLGYLYWRRLKAAPYRPQRGNYIMLCLLVSFPCLFVLAWDPVLKAYRENKHKPAAPDGYDVTGHRYGCERVVPEGFEDGETRPGDLEEGWLQDLDDDVDSFDPSECSSAANPVWFNDLHPALYSDNRD